MYKCEKRKLGCLKGFYIYNTMYDIVNQEVIVGSVNKIEMLCFVHLMHLLFNSAFTALACKWVISIFSPLNFIGNPFERQVVLVYNGRVVTLLSFSVILRALKGTY